MSTPASRATDGLSLAPLGPGNFGRTVEVATDARSAEGRLETLLQSADELPGALLAADGLLLIRGLNEISVNPSLLVELSRFFGERVEDYREALLPLNMVHEDLPEILIVSNAPPVNRAPPPRPDPPLTPSGELPTQFPHRRGWHTDQSYRRPPPDISLFYAVEPATPGQAQTLYANGTAAYAALPAQTRARIDSLDGIHCALNCERSEQEMRAGHTPRPLEAREQPQRQPLARLHPESGKRALFLCESRQMDWYEGPIAGLEPGPEGEGARLLYELMSHYTDARFVYAHEWQAGDLIIYDNRSTIHAATWFDADTYERCMWRTTVWGNPGPEYAGEDMSWLRGR